MGGCGIVLSTVSKIYLLYLAHCCDNLLNVVFIHKTNDNKAPHKYLDVVCDYFPDLMIVCVHIFHLMLVALFLVGVSETNESPHMW